MFQPRRSDLTAILVLPKIHNLTDAVLVRHLVFDVGELPQQEGNGFFGCCETGDFIPYSFFMIVVQLAVILPLEIQLRQSHSGVIIEKVDVGEIFSQHTFLFHQFDHLAQIHYRMLRYIFIFEDVQYIQPFVTL